MKRIGAFSLAIFIFVLSVFSVVPVNVRADDDKTVIPLVEGHFGLTESDAQSKVAAHKDIYYDNDQRAFAYTPASSYNWTLCNDKGAVTSTHLSDKQVVALLCSSNKFVNNRTLFTSFLSNNNIFRGFMSGVGALFTGDSDNGTKFLDTLTGNYNYLDSLNYDEDSQTITMSNDNGSVDKLREEIKNYYYDSIGIRFIYPTDNHNPAYLIELNRSLYDYEEDYISDFNALSQYDYAVGTSYGDYTTRLISGFDKNSYSYCYLGLLGGNNYIYFLDKDMNVINDSVLKIFNAQSYGSGNERIDLEYSFKSAVPLGSQLLLRLYSKSGDTYKEVTFYNGYTYDRAYFFSKNNKPFVYFSSYEKLFNFLNGSQTAYLSSRIDKAGEDISFSIKNMSENLGDKMDTLIDSINDKKGSMSADELQNAIDKGLEDLNKNTEDIKDNTSSILDKLEEQNQILLQILGVTEFIAYQEVKENSDQYNMSYLKTLLDSMFTGLFNALMYGENTVDDNNTDTASMQSFSVSNAAAPVAVYSDDIAVYDSSGSGGGSSFGGGSGSSGGHFFDLKNGLFGKFPFSIPYQCYNWLQILQRDPEAPTFTLDYGYLFGCSGDPKFVLSFDLSRYNDIAEVGRSFCRLFMTLMLALGIYHKNKGEM